MITRKQIEHYWYYYKWHFIAILLAIIAIVYTFYSCMSKVDPDLVVTYVGTSSLDYEEMQKFEQEYSKYISDANGDNKNVISMQKIEFAPKGDISDAEAEYASNMRLMAEFAGGKTTVYIFSSDMLEFFKQQEIMQPLDFIGMQDNYINLSGKEVLKTLKLPYDTYLAIRIQPKNLNEEEKIHYENAVKLVEAINK